jgi:UDP-N-acetylmuramoylalanine--D-glutamate ligase
MTGRRVAVVGFGTTGRAVARALLAAGDEVEVFDDRGPAGASEAAAAIGVVVEPTPAGAALAKRLEQCDLVVPSPGVPVGHPVFIAAAAVGIPVRAEIELAAQIAAGAGRPRVVAITGTNGKTTVTTAVTAILQASGLTAVAAGNIGLPMIEAVTGGFEVVVVEVSSFQLQFTDTFHPAVSCWLNLAPDHLDWHPTLDHYAAAKSRVWANQAAGDTAVYNAEDPIVLAAAGRIPDGVAKVTFALRERASYGVDGDRLIGPGNTTIIPVADLPRALPHDLANALAAAAVATAAGATPAGCRDGLASTPPPAHRVSLVGSCDGVDWFDDSKATTPASVMAAVAGFPSVVLIAGGRNKGLDLSPLGATVPPVRAVVAIGESAGDVDAAFSGRAPVATATSMEAAVDAAARLARPGDAVVLSPGCASFDWYTSYTARGDHFAAIVHRKIGGGGCQC